MTTPFCDLDNPCDKLSGRLLINQTYQGPAISNEFDTLSLGTLGLKRSCLYPYVRTTFKQEWNPKEACYGPVRSVLGLAPSEELTMDFRYTEQYDVTRLVQEAFETSKVTSHSQYTEQDTGDTGGFFDIIVNWVSGWGSILEAAGALVGAAVGGPVGAAIGTFVGGAVDEILGGDGDGGGAAQGTVNQIDEVLDTVEANQTRSLTETITSRSTVTERFIQRTLQNPYHDRSLELRFIPVFRRFEVVTELVRFHWGVALDVGRIAFPTTVAVAHAAFLQKRSADPRIAGLAATELGLEDEYTPTRRTGKVADHLNANSELYTKRYLLHALDQHDFDTLRNPVFKAIQHVSKTKELPRGISDALAWSKTSVIDKSIFVPGAEADIAVKALGLTENQRRKFRTKLDLLKTARILRRYKLKKDVHLYMGTKVEAVAGQCLLKDVPKPHNDA